MKTLKIVALSMGLVLALVVIYEAIVFARQAGAIVLATLRAGERTTEYNEQIAASLAGIKPGDRLTMLGEGLQSVLDETRLTLQAVRPALQETTATARSARLAIAETAATAKAARVAIEGAKVPDIEPVLRRTDTLLEQATTLVRETNAHASPLLATSERLLDRVDHLVSDRM